MKIKNNGYGSIICQLEMVKKKSWIFVNMKTQMGWNLQPINFSSIVCYVLVMLCVLWWICSLSNRLLKYISKLMWKRALTRSRSLRANNYRSGRIRIWNTGERIWILSDRDPNTGRGAYQHLPSSIDSAAWRTAQKRWPAARVHPPQEAAPYPWTQVYINTNKFS